MDEQPLFWNHLLTKFLWVIQLIHAQRDIFFFKLGWRFKILAVNLWGPVGVPFGYFCFGSHIFVFCNLCLKLMVAIKHHNRNSGSSICNIIFSKVSHMSESKKVSYGTLVCVSHKKQARWMLCLHISSDCIRIIYLYHLNATNFSYFLQKRNTTQVDLMR